MPDCDVASMAAQFAAMCYITPAIRTEIKPLLTPSMQDTVLVRHTVCRTGRLQATVWNSSGKLTTTPRHAAVGEVELTTGDGGGEWGKQASAYPGFTAEGRLTSYP